MAPPEQVDDGLVGEAPENWQSIIIEDYDPAWAPSYAATSSPAQGGFGRADPQHRTRRIHIGAGPGQPSPSSTSISCLKTRRTSPATSPPLKGSGTDSFSASRDGPGTGCWLALRKTSIFTFGRGTRPNPIRHRLFRDWLRSHPEDRELYAATKRSLAPGTRSTEPVTTAWRRTTSSTGSLHASSRQPATDPYLTPIDGELDRIPGNAVDAPGVGACGGAVENHDQILADHRPNPALSGGLPASRRSRHASGHTLTAVRTSAPRPRHRPAGRVVRAAPPAGRTGGSSARGTARPGALRGTG